MKNRVTIIEFTPTFVRLLCGFAEQNSVYVLQALEGVEFSLEDGLPIAREAADSLQLLIDKAKSTLGEKDIGPYILALSPISFFSSEGTFTTATADPNCILSLNDYKNCVNRAMKEKMIGEQTPVYCAPFHFATDDQEMLLYYPERCRTNNFAIDADVHTVDSAYYKRCKEILSRVGIEAYLTMVSTFGSSYFIDSYRANMTHYLLLDIEKEYCYLSYVDSGRLRFSLPLKENLNRFLENSAKKLNVDVKKAEEYLNIFGFFSTPGFDYTMENNLTLKDTSTCFAENFRPLACEVSEVILDKHVSADVPLILSGAGASIEDLDSLFAKFLSRNCVSFEPHIFGAQGGSYNSCLGALLLSALPYQRVEDYRAKENTEFSFHGNGFDR